ncbi:hypothetical protein [Vulgatibacter incomptus]|uniref:Uncharacterized protein n=2 Tax=Vulgatibacter incomptus TaxID=1391653 RepID=A0A0K1PJN6_9BACT|nr:hypothetical protein [Vulgatibacter incomptus]AKU93319.1 hypothetical protein AKJ08_3706 [Vulgatibacter incomptus]
MVIGLSALGGILGIAGVVCAALSVFLSGPPVLTRGARALAVGGLIVGAAGLLQELVANGFQFEPGQRGGQGSLLASGGMLLLVFGAARTAEQRRLRRTQERLSAARRQARDQGGSQGSSSLG